MLACRNVPAILCSGQIARLESPPDATVRAARVPAGDVHGDVISHAATFGWDPGAAVPGGQRAADRGELRGVPVLRAATFQRGGLPRLVLPVTVDNACGGPEPWGISWI